MATHCRAAVILEIQQEKGTKISPIEREERGVWGGKSKRGFEFEEKRRDRAAYREPRGNVNRTFRADMKKKKKRGGSRTSLERLGGLQQKRGRGRSKNRRTSL